MDLFTEIDGQINIREDLDLLTPMRIPNHAVLAGDLTALESCDLPHPGHVAISLDVETAPKAEWRSYGKIMGLDPHLAYVRLIQISDGTTCWIVDTHHTPNWQPWLSVVLDEAEFVIAHNARFEAKFCHVNLGRKPYVRWRCTYLASILLEYEELHKLDAVCYRWLGQQMDKTDQKSDWSAEHLSQSQVLYALRDVSSMHPLFDKMQNDIHERGMWQLYVENYCDIIPALAEIEVTGLPVNTDATHAAIVPLRAEVVLAEERCREHLFAAYTTWGNPDRLRRVLWETPLVSKRSRIPLPPEMTTKEQITLTKNNDLVQILYSLVDEHGVPRYDDTVVDQSTMFNHLAECDLVINGEPVNIISDILAWKSKSKLLEFLTKLDTEWSPELGLSTPCRHPVTNRIHTEFTYAVTGRLIAGSGSGDEDSMGDLIERKRGHTAPWMMNVQQFPRDSHIRSCFGFPGAVASGAAHEVPVLSDAGLVIGWEHGKNKAGEVGTWIGGVHPSKPGEWGLISADYSALEAFILAHLSQDSDLISAVQSTDYHRTNASRIYHVLFDEVVPWQRQIAKNVGYCTAYGGGAAKIAQTANMGFIREGLRFRITIEEAEQAQEGFFKAYPRVQDFLEAEFRYVHQTGWTRPLKFGQTRNIDAEIEAQKRRRHATERINPRTKAYNHPMQGTNALIIQRALRSIYFAVVKEFQDDFEFGTPVHDEQLLFGTREILPRLGEIQAECMQRAADEVLSDEDGVPTFTTKVAPSFGPSWGHVH